MSDLFLKQTANLREGCQFVLFQDMSDGSHNLRAIYSEPADIVANHVELEDVLAAWRPGQFHFDLDYLTGRNIAFLAGSQRLPIQKLRRRAAANRRITTV